MPMIGIMKTKREKAFTYFFEKGGITIIHQKGKVTWCKTPSNLTGFEHLEQLKKSYTFLIG